MLNLVALILLFPLIGTSINGLFGKGLRKETVEYVAIVGNRSVILVSNTCIHWTSSPAA